MRRMQKIFGAFTICMVILLSGCSNGDKVANQENRAIESKVTDIKIQVTDDINIPMEIPNPENASGEVHIQLKDIELMDNYLDFKEDCIPFFVDLSFAGLSENSMITGFSIGRVTELEDYFFDISYNLTEKCTDKKRVKKGVKEKRIEGDSLILSVAAGTSDEITDWAHYLVVLDYGNRKYYTVKTDFACAATHLPEVELSDLTGDGLEDIVVSNVLNGYRSGTSVEIFRFDGIKKEFKKILSNCDAERGYTGIGSQCFSGQLKDNYKAVIECNQINYSKEISLIRDCGYRKKEMEVKNNVDGMKEDRLLMLYKKGELQKKLDYFQDVYVSEVDCVDGLEIFSGNNEKDGLKLKYPVYFGHWYTIGYMHTYLDYDENVDEMVIKLAEFKPSWNEY